MSDYFCQKSSPSSTLTISNDLTCPSSDDDASWTCPSGFKKCSSNSNQCAGSPIPSCFRGICAVCNPTTKRYDCPPSSGYYNLGVGDRANYQSNLVLSSTSSHYRDLTDPSYSVGYNPAPGVADFCSNDQVNELSGSILTRSDTTPQSTLDANADFQSPCVLGTFNSSNNSPMTPRPNPSDTKTTGYRVVSEDENPFYVRRKESLEWGETGYEEPVYRSSGTFAGDWDVKSGVGNVDECEQACTASKRTVCSDDRTVNGCLLYSYDPDTLRCTLYNPAYTYCSGTGRVLRVDYDDNA